jgi:hypothetical protein
MNHFDRLHQPNGHFGFSKHFFRELLITDLLAELPNFKQPLKLRPSFYQLSSSLFDSKSENPGRIRLKHEQAS